MKRRMERDEGKLNGKGVFTADGMKKGLGFLTLIPLIYTRFS